MTEGSDYKAPGVSRAQMRVSTMDRDRAVEVLAKAYTEGRLTKDEHDTRVEQAMTASTFADLDAVVADLPSYSPPAYRPPAPPVAPRTNALAVASLACGIAQVIVGPLGTIPAIALGHLARHQIRRTGEGGAGLALAGLLLGWAAVALAGLLIIVGSIAMMGVARHGVPVGPGSP
jgi:Domain of unknown function (DUF1707)/Domain of unknown function (DUF4190)